MFKTLRVGTLVIGFLPRDRAAWQNTGGLFTRVWKGLGWLRSGRRPGNGHNMVPTWAKLEPSCGEHGSKMSQLGTNLKQLGGYLEASWGMHDLRCPNWIKMMRHVPQKSRKFDTPKGSEEQISMENARWESHRVKKTMRLKHMGFSLSLSLYI